MDHYVIDKCEVNYINVQLQKECKHINKSFKVIYWLIWTAEMW
jgi:hypothetical protein